MFAAPFLSTLLHRVKAVVRRVAGPVAERIRKAPVPAATAQTAPVSPVLRALARGWMQAKLRALSALTQRIEAGQTVELDMRAPVAAKRAGGPAIRSPIPTEERLPRGFGWMCDLEPSMHEAGHAFAAWLDEPWMKAKVMAAPAEMARVISPMLRAMGAAPPKWFPERGKVSVLRCRSRPVSAAETAASCKADDTGSEFGDDVESDLGSRGGTPPLAPPTRGEGFLLRFRTHVALSDSVCSPLAGQSRVSNRRSQK